MISNFKFCNVSFDTEDIPIIEPLDFKTPFEITMSVTQFDHVNYFEALYIEELSSSILDLLKKQPLQIPDMRKI